MKKFFWFATFLSLIFLFAGCQREAPTINIDELSESTIIQAPGYFYPVVMSDLTTPTDGATAIPVNQQICLVFNLKVKKTSLDTGLVVKKNDVTTLAVTTDYTISTPSGTDSTIAKILLKATSVSNNDKITIEANNNILSSVEDVPLQTNYSFSYNLIEATDSIPPTIVEAQLSPTNGASDLARTGLIIDIPFGEGIDPATLNTNNVCLTDSVDNIVQCDYLYALKNLAGTDYNTLTLTPQVYLQKNETYKIKLTTGIQDLSGNPLGANKTYTFTTINQENDPTVGLPSIATAPKIADIGSTTAEITWANNENTKYTVSYGRATTDLSSNKSETNFSIFHQVDLTGLTAGKRYYAQIDFTDVANNSANYQYVIFNTLTNETPIDFDVSNDKSYNSASYPFIPVLDTSAVGALVYWTKFDGHSKIYASIFDQNWLNIAGWNKKELWTANNNYQITGLCADGHDGFLFSASKNGAGFYVKNINNDGSFNHSQDANSDGLIIDSSAGVTNGQAIPVYANLLTVNSGYQNEHDILSEPLFFYEYDPDNALSFYETINNNDLIINKTNQTWTHLKKAVSDDFARNIIPMRSDIGLTAGDQYVIGDTLFQETITVTNHVLVVGTNYTNGGDKIYTAHGYSLPAWLNVGDLVCLGNEGEAASTIKTITEHSFNSFYSGSNVITFFNNITDSSVTNFATLGVVINDIVKNTTVPAYAQVTGISGNNLTLDSDIFSDGDDYAIYHESCNTHGSEASVYEITTNENINATDGSSITFANAKTTGTADPAISNPLLEEDGLPALTTGKTGDFIINTNSGVASYIQTWQKYFLSLAANIFGISSTTYSRFKLNVNNLDYDDFLFTGKATATTAFHLIDTTKAFNATVTAKDIIQNISTGESAQIINVTNTDLTLNRDIFTVGQNYVIISANPVALIWAKSGRLYYQVKNFKITTPTTLTNTLDLTSGTNPYAYSDGQGNIMIIYEDSNEIKAVKLDSTGNAVWPIKNICSNIGTKAIKKIIKQTENDGTTSLFIFFSLNGSGLYLQKITAAGILWQAAAYQVTASTTTEEQALYLTAEDKMLVTAIISNRVYYFYLNIATASEIKQAALSSPTIGIQKNPQLSQLSATEILVSWEDSRFVSYAGYGIFAQKLSLTPTTVTLNWSADTANSDYNGIAAILNSYNNYWSNHLAVPFGANKSKIIWEDYRQNQDSNLQNIDSTAITN